MTTTAIVLAVNVPTVVLFVWLLIRERRQVERLEALLAEYRKGLADEIKEWMRT